MKVLITGATGFFGLRLCRWLADKGYEVIGIGRNETNGARLQTMGARFIKCDLANIEGLDELLPEIDCVVHSAALSSAWGRYLDFYDANVVGTHKLVDACTKAGVPKLIHISTTSLYFDFKDRFDVKETDPLAARPASNYTKSKGEAEEIVQSMKPTNWIILRPRGIFGPGDKSLLPRALRVAKKGWFPLVNKGEALVDLTYVDNLAHAVERCIQTADTNWNRIYNISNDEPIHVKDFFDQLMQELNWNPKRRRVPLSLALFLARILEIGSKVTTGREPMLTRYTAGLLGISQTLNIDEAKKRLGYQPLIGMREGIAIAAEDFREAPNK